jgi:hypothetical protein
MRRSVALIALLALAGCGSAAKRSATVQRGQAPLVIDQSTAAAKRAAAAKPDAAQPKVAKHRKRIPHVPAPGSRALRPKHHATATSRIAPGAPSDAEVARELAKAMGYKSGQASAHTVIDRGILQPNGLVSAPPSAPYAVQAIITAGNEVAHLPYVYGGGHGTWIDNAYDCSGSVSFALANAGFLGTQEDSSQLAKFGAPGPGHWVTIYANAQHAYMVVAGIRFDTSGRDGPRGSRWQAAMRSNAGFTVRHPPGL